MVAHSAGMNGIQYGNNVKQGFSIYILILIAIDLVALAGIGLGEFFAIKQYRRKDNEVEVTG